MYASSIQHIYNIYTACIQHITNRYATHAAPLYNTTKTCMQHICNIHTARRRVYLHFAATEQRLFDYRFFHRLDDTLTWTIQWHRIVQDELLIRDFRPGFVAVRPWAVKKQWWPTKRLKKKHLRLRKKTTTRHLSARCQMTAAPASVRVRAATRAKAMPTLQASSAQKLNTPWRITRWYAFVRFMLFDCYCGLVCLVLWCGVCILV